LLPELWLWLWLMIATLVGIWACDACARQLGVHDHSAIVWDEFVGMWLTLLAAPATLGGAIAAFLLFRLFDILKPWPIRWVDRRVGGGLGIMLDDILAALPAAAILWGIAPLLP
jgi:phosphatidylglycerophosphatase A